MRGPAHGRGARRACSILVLVGRSKVCWDYAFTVLLGHVACVAAHGGRVPMQRAWWLMHLGAFACVTLVAQQLCMFRELQPIRLHGAAGAAAPRAPLAHGAAALARALWTACCALPVQKVCLLLRRHGARRAAYTHVRDPLDDPGHNSILLSSIYAYPREVKDV